MKTLKTTLKLIWLLLLVAAPLAGRWFWFHPGSYHVPTIPTVDLAQAAIPTVEYKSYTEQPRVQPARLLVDRAHENNLQIDDLTPLLDRLTRRGAAIKNYDSDSESLASELRGSTAFLVIAPAYPFSAEEGRAVVDFVKNGGRLFLAADPTRSVPSGSDYGYTDLTSLFFPESAVPAMNSLANRFGISFYEDYLYNLKNYDTNYRNVKIVDFAANPLTEGLQQVTLFAAHSLKSDGQALFTGDADTLSNVRTAETALTPAALSVDKNVLALGDLSILLTPYHRMADNDRFLSNVADWLSTSQRAWRLQDFPYTFRRPVDLILLPVSDEGDAASVPGVTAPLTDTVELPLSAASFDLLSPLQALFVQAGQSLELRQQPSSDHDVIYVAAYRSLDPLQEILASAGVSVTLVEKKTAAAKTDESAPTATPEAVDVTPTPAPKSTLSIAGVGVFEIAGAQLFLLNQTGAQTSLVILGEDSDALAAALERLTYADFSGCVIQDSLMLCSTTPAPVPETGGSSEEPSSSDNRGDIFILAVDSGSGRSSAPEWEAALSGYDVAIWSVSQDGIPTYEDVTGYKAYIMDMGDYPYDADLYAELPYMEGSYLVIGEQPSDPAYYDGAAPLADLQVEDGTHPLANGLDGTITLLDSNSGTPALIQPVQDSVTEGLSVVLARGPASENAGTPVLFAYEYADLDFRYALASFAFYRLPEELQTTFAVNVVEWLMNQTP